MKDAATAAVSGVIGTCLGPECRWFRHASDCAVHNAPAVANGPCDCTEMCPSCDGVGTLREEQPSGGAFVNDCNRCCGFGRVRP